MKVIDKDILRIKDELKLKEMNLQEMADDRKQWRGMVQRVFGGIKSEART